MAKSGVLILSALGILALANFVVSKHEVAEVTGKVFCDSCHLGLVTPLSGTIQGSTVRLTCKNNGTNKETYSAESETDMMGKYTFRVEGDYWNDICEVTAVNSPREDCKEIVPELVKKMPQCIKTVGTPSTVCLTNPLFFRKDKPLPSCERLLEDLKPEDLKALIKLQKFI